MDGALLSLAVGKPPGDPGASIHLSQRSSEARRRRTAAAAPGVQAALALFASAASAAARSVRSQVNSGSVRPKWP